MTPIPTLFANSVGSVSRNLTRFGSVIVVGLALDCRAEQPTEPSIATTRQNWEPNAVAALPAIQPGDSAAVDSLARGFAGALSDPALRKRLHADLRDSPFPQHRIHLQSYLSGADGAVLLAAIGRVSGLSIGRLHSILAIRSGLQLLLPSSIDRMNWLDEKEVYVEGTARTIAERRESESHFPAGSNLSSAVAFSSRQTKHPRGLLSESNYSWLSISPIERPFGADPELQRITAPRHSRVHVSTFEEEIALYKARGDSMVRASGDSGIKTLTSFFPH